MRQENIAKKARRQSVKQRRRFSHLALSGLTFIGLVSLMLSACQSVNMRGAATKEQVVDVYVRALESKDERSILSLIPETHIAEQAIQAKVAQLGGHDIQEMRVNYSSPIKPQFAVAEIRGWYVADKSEKLEFKDKINLKQDDGRWYLIMGRARNGVVDTPAQVR
jgi:hypothetical protein